MNSLERVTSLLDSYCVDKITQAGTISPRYAALWREIHHYLMSGGKRMRPRLVLLAHDAYDGAPNKGIISVAAAWELLHACLLVHDDIIDRDFTRHGKPNIAGVYQSVYGKRIASGADHYALSTALLGGDLLLVSAYEMIATAPLGSDTKVSALSYLNQALFAVAGGELIDTDSILFPIEQSTPHSVAVHKTASYSLQLPLQCGAALAGASDKELEKLSQLGLHLGVAYQLHDDLLGIFGDTAKTGKSNRSDIIEKKRTYLVQKVLDKLEDTQAARFRELFEPNHVVSSAEAEELFGLIASSGARSTVEQEIENNTSQALAILETLQIEDSYKQYFSKLIEQLTARTN